MMKACKQPKPTPLLDGFRALLQWELKPGSHAWPQAVTGGTCILEGALLVSGAPYRPIRSFEEVPTDLPDGFCLAASQYLLALNDFLHDEPRQKLILVMLRLPGSIDPALRSTRTRYIVYRTVTELLPELLRAIGMSALEKRCRSLPKGEAARKVVSEILGALRAAKILRRDASPLSTCAEIAATLQMVQGYASDRKISMATTLSIVDGTLDLGHDKRRPLQIGMALANARLERARNTPMPIEEEPEAAPVTETA